MGLYRLVGLVFIKLVFCELTPVRLINGPSNCSGRVELFYDNVWGSVCDDFWDSQNAQVVCRQLKCGVALAGPGNAFYGQSQGPILMDDVVCGGNELNLTMCQNSGWRNHNCGHHEDAGAICSEHLPKPSVSIAVMNHTLQLTCTLPKLMLNLMVYIINTQTNETLNKARVSHLASGLLYLHSGRERQGVYACQYEATKRNASFRSPLSDPLCVVRADNGSVTTVSESLSQCLNGALTTPWRPLSATVVSLVMKNGTATDSTTDATPLPSGTTGNSTTVTIPLHIGTAGHSTTDAIPLVSETPAVIITSIVVPIAAVLLAVLIIFIAYRRRRKNRLQKTIENEYTDCKQQKAELPYPTYVNELHIYESVSGRNGVIKESNIYFVGSTNLYESLNIDTKSKDIYEVLK